MKDNKRYVKLFNSSIINTDCVVYYYSFSVNLTGISVGRKNECVPVFARFPV